MSSDPAAARASTERIPVLGRGGVCFPKAPPAGGRVPWARAPWIGDLPGLALPVLLAAEDWMWPSLALAAVGITALLAWAILRIVREAGHAGTAMVKAGGDAAVQVADRLAATLRNAFNVEPRIVVDGVTRDEGVVTTRELVTAKQRLRRRHEWSNTRLWSTKKVSLNATYTVKAGFDLSQAIEIDVDRGGGRAEVRWPAPRILAVQMEAVEPATEESGWWNRITPADRAAVQAEMQLQLEEDARAGGLLHQAEVELRTLLEDQAPGLGRSVSLHFEPGSRRLPDAAGTDDVREPV